MLFGFDGGLLFLDGVVELGDSGGDVSEVEGEGFGEVGGLLGVHAAREETQGVDDGEELGGSEMEGVGFGVGAVFEGLGWGGGLFVELCHKIIDGKGWLIIIGIVA